jgi:hypothetical protein
MYREILMQLRRPWYDEQESAEQNAPKLLGLLNEFGGEDEEEEITKLLTIVSGQADDPEDVLDEVYGDLLRRAE